MLKRPSSRRKSKNAQVQLNLVPILDAMVTLIGFLLFTMSFLAIVSIESPFPESAARPLDEKVKERPLQLTVSLHDKDTEIWSPFNKFEAKTIPNAPDGHPDVKAVHDFLVTIKLKFPTENKVVLTPTRTSTYDILIALMDGFRGLEPTDPPIFIKNVKTGMDEPQKKLFPEVIFGNLLGVD